MPFNLLGKQKTPKERVDEWSKNIRVEQRKIRSQIREIERQQTKVKMSIKQSAKKNDMASVKILATEMVHSNKAITNLNKCNAEMNSMIMQMKEQLANIRLTGAIQKSSVVMSSMNNVIKLPEINSAMMKMAKEMEKAGLIEEMLDDTLDSVLNTDDIEDKVDQEVAKVVFDLTKIQLEGLDPMAGSKLPGNSTSVVNPMVSNSTNPMLN